MAIQGQEQINVGVVNQSTGSDDLYTAFNKVQNNFTHLFQAASPYNTFVAGPGTGVTSNAQTGTVTVTNNGVISIVPGTGIAVTSGNGNVTISATGGSGGNVGVTNIAIGSNTLSVTGGPIISRGIITLDLPVTANVDTFTAGEYIAPTLTVDKYGRISKIANTTSVGTVTSVAIASNGGLSVTGGPITSSGTITLKNTGVTKITAGSGITVTGQTGDITISSTSQNFGTVTRVDVTSSSLTVTGGTILTSGTIGIELPSSFTVTGKIQSANLVSTGPIYAATDVVSGNLVANANITANGTIAAANITANIFTGTLNGAHNGTIGVTTPNTAVFTTLTANTITTSNIANIGGNLLVSGIANVTGNISTSGYFKGNGSQLTGVLGPVTSMYASVSVSIPTGTGVYVMKYASADSNSTNTSYYDNSTGRFTPLVAGWYQINMSCLPTFPSNLSNHYGGFFAGLYKNSSPIAQGNGATVRAGWGQPGITSATTMVYLNGTTDYVLCALVSIDVVGASWTTSTGTAIYFQAAWIRP